MSKTIDIRDALDLENYEQVRIKNRIVRRAINDTYGTKSATKKRRVLPGKRKWKDKQKYYAKLEGSMMVEEYNSKTKASKAVERIWKQKHQKKHMLYGDE